jgi:glycosyltransferase involved in cell wall biosynthesis
MTAPAVSVVVATHNRATLLPRLVGALEGQRSAPPFEVVIVDDASTDDTAAVLDELARSTTLALRVERLARNAGPATARNVGWQTTRAPLVAFTDDDCVPEPGWLVAIVDGLAHADMVQGRTVPDPAQQDRHGPFSRTLDVSSESGFYQTCNMAYRRKWLERVGGFDEKFRHPTGEDTDVAWRAKANGAVSAFRSDAVVRHDVRPSSFVTHLRDTWRWEGVVLAVRLHPDLRSLLHRRWWWKPTHPPAALAAAGFAVAASGATPLRRAIGLACVLPYVRLRMTSAPLRGGPRRRVAAIPLALVADVTEVGVMAAASVRYRTLLL